MNDDVSETSEENALIESNQADSIPECEAAEPQIDTLNEEGELNDVDSVEGNATCEEKIDSTFYETDGLQN